MSTRVLRLFLLSAAAGCAEYRSLTSDTDADGATPDAHAARPSCTGEDIAVQWRLDVEPVNPPLPVEPLTVEGDGFYWMAWTGDGSDVLRMGPDLEIDVVQRFPEHPQLDRNLFVTGGSLHYAEWDHDEIHFGPLEGPLQTLEAEAISSVEDAGEERLLLLHDGQRNGQPYSVYRHGEREATGTFPGGRVHPRPGQMPMYSFVTRETQLMMGEFGGTQTRLPTPGCGGPPASVRLWYDALALSDGSVAWVYSCDGAGGSHLSKRTSAGAVHSVALASEPGHVSLTELADGTLLTAAIVDGDPVLGLFDGETLASKGSSVAPRPVYSGDIPGGGTFVIDMLLGIELTPAATGGTFLLSALLSIPDGVLRLQGVGILCPPT